MDWKYAIVSGSDKKKIKRVQENKNLTTIRFRNYYVVQTPENKMSLVRRAKKPLKYKIINFIQFYKPICCL